MEIRRFTQRVRSFATAELSDERVQAIGSSRMNERHAHVDAVLEPNDGSTTSKQATPDTLSGSDLST